MVSRSQSLDHKLSMWFFHNLVQTSPYQKLFDIFVVGYNAIMNCHKFYKKKEKTTNVEKEK